MNRRIGTILATTVAVILAVIFAQSALAARPATVSICHSTGSNSNPYVVNSPAASGDVGGHNIHTGPLWYDGAEAWGDIIPPFDYDGGSYPGLNWTAEGQAIYNNGCNPVDEVEPTPIPTATETPTEEPVWTTVWFGFSHCVGWWYVGQDYLNGEPYGGSYAGPFGLWQDPYELEIVSLTGPADAIYEPEECLVEPTEIPPTEIPPTDIVDPTPTPTEEPTEEPTPESTSTVPPLCDNPKPEPCGELFHLIGPYGQEAWFASFSSRGDGTFYLPSASSQQRCLGWVAVSAPESRLLYGNEVLTPCDGGGCFVDGGS